MRCPISQQPLYFPQVDKSDLHTVVMRSVTLETSGRYRCEVSADAPTFHTAMVARWMHVVGECSRGWSAGGANGLLQSHFHAQLIASAAQTKLAPSCQGGPSRRNNQSPLPVLWAASARPL